MRIFLALLAFVLLADPVLAAPCDKPVSPLRVSAREECLIARTFESKEGASPRLLYVLLHGNHSDGSPATSMFKVAQGLVDKAPPGTVAVALLRPGYNDEEGNYSTGERNRVDNWRSAVIDDIADAIANLKRHYHPQRLVLIGHSGGSAVAGVILGRHPGLADAALLFGCVCDIRQWRAGRSGGMWTSESPSDYVTRIPPKTKIAVLVGAGDNVTTPSLSEGYVAALADQGLPVDYKAIEGRDHYNIIRSEQIIETALKLGVGE
ncbi:MAG: alpha/beta hydrolase [Alphaproteobacteria bacterium]|nr:alpha/beta hydrolase [Alphaproteobacteria bacterium]